MNKKIVLISFFLLLSPSLILGAAMTNGAASVVVAIGSSEYSTVGGETVWVLPYDMLNRNETATASVTSGAGSGADFDLATGDVTGQLSVVDQNQGVLLTKDFYFFSIVLTGILSAVLVLLLYKRRKRRNEKLESLYDGKEL